MKQKNYTITLEQKTEVIIGSGTLQTLGVLIRDKKYTSITIISSKTPYQLFAPEIRKVIENLHIPVYDFLSGDGEDTKSIQTVTNILKFLVEKNVDRRGCVIALGGGIIGDMATVISGLYQRGVDCIQIPTTLLSQVDSAFGGKGGVNFEKSKNLIGLTRQPTMIVIDTNVLKTLPEIQLRSGMGEVLKYAIALDKNLFELLENSNDILTNAEEMIERCSNIKMSMVENDPEDIGNIRVSLNFGHTLGHAIELTRHMHHGLAVAVGMGFATRLSTNLGLLSENLSTRVINLLEKYDLPTKVENLDTQDALKRMRKDKKAVGGKIKLVLLKEIGKTEIVNDIPEEKIIEALKETSK